MRGRLTIDDEKASGTDNPGNALGKRIHNPYAAMAPSIGLADANELKGKPLDIFPGSKWVHGGKPGELFCRCYYAFSDDKLRAHCSTDAIHA
jgi:hypothetical protein